MREGSGQLICVSPDLIGSVWPMAEPLLRSGYASGDESVPENLLEWLRQGSGQLWVYIRGEAMLAAMITTLEIRPSGLACRLGATGGVNLQQWRDCEARIAEYARAEGCVKTILEGRPGWSRVLPGYSTARVVLEKVL